MGTHITAGSYSSNDTNKVIQIADLASLNALTVKDTTITYLVLDADGLGNNASYIWNGLNFEPLTQINGANNIEIIQDIITGTNTVVHNLGSTRIHFTCLVPSLSGWDMIELNDVIYTTNSIIFNSLSPLVGTKFIFDF